MCDAKRSASVAPPMTVYTPAICRPARRIEYSNLMISFETLLYTFFTSVFATGIATWALKTWGEHWLKIRFEKYKDALDKEAEIARLKLQNFLQADLYRYQTTFALHHNKRAEVIGEIYSLLFEAKESVEALVHIKELRKDVEVQRGEAEEKCNKLAYYFNKHRIYIDESICEKMDELTLSLKIAVVLHNFGRTVSREPMPDIAMGEYHIGEAARILKEKFPPLEKELQMTFREVLEGTDSSLQTVVK